MSAKCEELFPLKAARPLENKSPLSKEKMILVQANASYCEMAAALVGQADSGFSNDKRGLVIRNYLVNVGKKSSCCHLYKIVFWIFSIIHQLLDIYANVEHTIKSYETITGQKWPMTYM